MEKYETVTSYIQYAVGFSVQCGRIRKVCDFGLSEAERGKEDGKEFENY